MWAVCTSASASCSGSGSTLGVLASWRSIPPLLGHPRLEVARSGGGLPAVGLEHRSGNTAPAGVSSAVRGGEAQQFRSLAGGDRQRATGMIFGSHAEHPTLDVPSRFEPRREAGHEAPCAHGSAVRVSTYASPRAF